MKINQKTENTSDSSKLTVGSFARMPIPTVNRSTPVSEIAALMVNCNIGAVIVVRDAEPLGIVTEKDLVQRVIHANKNAQEVVAQEIMTAPVITISFDRTMEDALEIMRRNRVRRLVVLKGENMVGLLTERRILRANFSCKPKSDSVVP